MVRFCFVFIFIFKPCHPEFFLRHLRSQKKFLQNGFDEVFRILYVDSSKNISIGVLTPCNPPPTKKNISRLQNKKLNKTSQTLLSTYLLQINKN